MCIDMTPKRVQLSRRKGSRKPVDTIVVTRPGRYGNPFTNQSDRWGDYVSHKMTSDDRAVAVEKYRKWMSDDLTKRSTVCCNSLYYDRPTREHIAKLRGHDLACWCPLDQPCHADVLLEMANE